jgi:hypothetical protein
VVALLVLLGPLGHGFGGWPGPQQVGPGVESAPWGRGGGFGGPPALLVWALLIGGAIVLSRNGWSFRRVHADETPASAEDLLRWRYAAGEISREEFLEMSRVVHHPYDGIGSDPRTPTRGPDPTGSA